MILRTVAAVSVLALAACNADREAPRDATTEPPAGAAPAEPTPVSDSPHPTARPAEASDTQCRQGERALYNCRFDDGSVASVCSGERNSYRYGPLGDPEIDISRAPGEAGVWQGTVVGQGGGHQTHIRFRNGGYDYIVLSGEDGSLADNPGRVYSGVVVMRGEAEVARLDCPVTTYQTAIPTAMVPMDIAHEAEGGPFDGWF